MKRNFISCICYCWLLFLYSIIHLFWTLAKVCFIHFSYILPKLSSFTFIIKKFGKTIVNIYCGKKEKENSIKSLMLKGK